MSAAVTRRPMPARAAAAIASEPRRKSARRRSPPRDLLAWLTLALATLAILWPLGLTNRVLAGVDALTYFTPYWAYRMAELRAGQMPLWNPYLFLGVPFLANPQAAVLYPLHWPLSWLRPEQALVWSALLHVWLAAGFTYTFARRSLGRSRLAAWLAGLIFGLGGFTLARVENINQLNALAWLPALLWLYDETARAASWRSRIRWGAALAVAIALQLLAGHTQTTFVNMVGLGLWAGWPVVVGCVERRRSGGGRRRRGDTETASRRRRRTDYAAARLPAAAAGGHSSDFARRGATAAHAGIERSGPAHRRAALPPGRQLLTAAALAGTELAAAVRSRAGRRVRQRGLCRICRLRRNRGAGAGGNRPVAAVAAHRRGNAAAVERSARDAAGGVGVSARPRRIQSALLSAVARDPRLRPVPCTGTLAGAVCAGRGCAGRVRAGRAGVYHGDTEARRRGDAGTRRHGDTATGDKGTRRARVGANVRQLRWRSCCSPR